MKRQLIVSLFFLNLLVATVAGQAYDKNNFTRYTTTDGMSHNTVTGIVQDSIGFVWISTPYGLNRFNGRNFVQFHSNTDSLSLPGEELAGMSWLNGHRLAVFTTGLHIINTKTGSVHNLFIPYHNRQYQFKFNIIMDASGDVQGNSYILTRSGFYHYDSDYKLLSRFDFYSEEQVPVTHFYFGRGLFELDSNRMLITSIGGLYIYDKKRRQLRRMITGDSPLLDEFLDYPERDYQFYQPGPGSFFLMNSDNNKLVYINVAENRKVVSTLPFDSARAEFGWRSKMITVNDTLFYITGHHSGFFKLHLNPASGLVTCYPEKYFQSYLCSDLLVDKSGNLWVATSRGLFRQDPQKSVVQTTYLPGIMEDSFPDIRIDDIFVSKDKVYAGARGNAGLFLFDKKTLHLDKQIMFTHKRNDFRVNNIRALVPADRSNLLIGTLGPLLLFDITGKKEKLVIPEGWNEAGDWTSDMYKDRKGNIWIASRNIYKFSPLPGKFKVIANPDRLLSVPYAITEDTGGHIWMAGHGLARYNTILDSFDIMLDSFPFIKIPDKQVNALVIDRQNTAWFNSNNNGLISYNIHRKQFRQFTRQNGLPDDNIATLIIIGNKLWMAFYSGIACLDLGTLQIVSFGKEDGFPDMPVAKGARFFYDSILHQLYIGFSTAIVRFNPDELLRKRIPPQTFIESLVINGKESYFLPGKVITTTWEENDLRITIGSINFYGGNSQGFAYRILIDSNSVWQQLGTQSSFNISNLPPGVHTIQVKSFSLNNRWEEEVREIVVTVEPAFWQETWFKILALIILMTLIYLLIIWRTAVVRKKEMEKTHLQKLKADDYRNQFELEQISNYFSSSLAEKKTESEVLWDVAGNLIARLNYVDCMIYLWNKDKTKMIQKAAYGLKGKPEIISSQVFDVFPGQGVVGFVIEHRQPVLIEDTRKDSRYRVDEAYRLSEICVPIIHNDELMGVIDSEHHEPGYFSERDIKILTTIATLIGNKLNQIKSEQSLEAKRKELAGINEQLAEAKLSALQAQMNPHFVFNALNSIKRMILDGENEKASRYLSKFALMIRMTLDHSRDTFVTLDENIKYLRTYLEMEQLRFDDSFNWSIVTDDQTDTEETAIPSLMIQPLVENAIWHGLMQVEGEKKIQIGFVQEQNKITCSIEDNGIGILRSERLKHHSKASHRSVGLENLRNRIKIMNEKYNLECTLTITDLGQTDETSRGTLALLVFNVINL